MSIESGTFWECGGCTFRHCGALTRSATGSVITAKKGRRMDLAAPCSRWVITRELKIRAFAPGFPVHRLSGGMTPLIQIAHAHFVPRCSPGAQSLRASEASLPRPWLCQQQRTANPYGGQSSHISGRVQGCLEKTLTSYCWRMSKPSTLAPTDLFQPSCIST